LVAADRPGAEPINASMPSFCRTSLSAPSVMEDVTGLYVCGSQRGGRQSDLILLLTLSFLT